MKCEFKLRRILMNYPCVMNKYRTRNNYNVERTCYNRGVSSIRDRSGKPEVRLLCGPTDLQRIARHEQTFEQKLEHNRVQRPKKYRTRNTEQGMLKFWSNGNLLLSRSIEPLLKLSHLFTADDYFFIELLAENNFQ